MKARLTGALGSRLKTGVLLYTLTFILGLGLSLFLPAFLNWGHMDPHSAFQAIS